MPVNYPGAQGLLKGKISFFEGGILGIGQGKNSHKGSGEGENPQRTDQGKESH